MLDTAASLRPMIPARAPRPFQRPGWVYEEKVDGFRMLAVKTASRVRLLSRRGYDMGERFPGIVAGLAALPASSLVLDGEVAVFDEGFVSHLGYLMGRVEPEGSATLPMLIAFDCLGARGRDLTREPLRERRAVLELELELAAASRHVAIVRGARPERTRRVGAGRGARMGRARREGRGVVLRAGRSDAALDQGEAPHPHGVAWRGRGVPGRK